MQSQDQYSETTSLQLQLKSVTEKFDLAVKKDVEWGELNIYPESYNNRISVFLNFIQNFVA